MHKRYSSSSSLTGAITAAQAATSTVIIIILNPEDIQLRNGANAKTVLRIIEEVSQEQMDAIIRKAAEKVKAVKDGKEKEII